MGSIPRAVCALLGDRFVCRSVPGMVGRANPAGTGTSAAAHRPRAPEREREMST